MIRGTIRHLVAFLEKLKSSNIHYSLSSPTDAAIMVEVAVPGERWEVEFHAEGHIGVEIFVSKVGVQDESLLEDLFTRFSD